MSDDRTFEALSALLEEAGLVVSADEARRLATLYARFAGDRARLAQVDLGETEPAVTFVPSIEALEP
jgi:hypothetical protein